MAKQTIVTMTDDLDPSVEADETVDFSLDGKGYEIDLSDEHAGELRDALAPYVAAARKAGHGGGHSHKPVKFESGGNRRSDSAENAKIREWVRDNGGHVNERGRIKREYVDAYRRGDASIFKQVNPDEGGQVEVPNVEASDNAGVQDPFAVHF